MDGEHKAERSALATGVDKGLQPITAAGDDLEKMKAVGGGDDKVDIKKKKKARFIWTHELHKCFLDAVQHLGFHRAVPTKILELMNIEDLTRENVASHLQKFRLQKKRREEERERAQALAASGNVPKAVYPPMSGIPQQPWDLPNTTQGINMECACLDPSQLAPSFANHNLNMIQGFPTVQEVYGTPFKDGGVNRMSRFELEHVLYDSNGPYDISKFVHNYGPLPQTPLVDSYAHNLMDRSYFHDTTRVPLYNWRHELSLADQAIISPSFVPQYIRHDELSLADPGSISPSFVPQYDQGDELSLADPGSISPSSVPQYDRHDELPVTDQGIISPSVAQEGFGVGMTRLPEATGGLTGIGLGGLGVRVPHLSEAIGGLIGMKVGGFGVGVPHPPSGGLAGMKAEGLGGFGVGVTHPPKAVGGFAGLKAERPEICMPRPPEATGGIMKVEGHGLGMPLLPEATGGLSGMKVEELGAGVTHLPESTGGPRLSVTHLPEATGGPGLGVPPPPVASGGRAGMNDFRQGFSLDEDQESALDFSEFWMNMKGDVDGKSFDDLFRR